MRRTAILGLCLAALWPAVMSAQAQGDTAFTRQVDSAAQRVLATTGVPSASVAVVRDGRIVYAQAYGKARLDPDTPALPTMRYSIGSISKQFTAAVILLLAEQHRLSLDDHVSRWLPGLTRAREVTVRELLSHTSGYQDFWPQDYVPPLMQRPISADSIMTLWAKKPLDFDPGTRWQYSNTNFVIAGVIVEKVTRRPFFDVLKSRILEPLGMRTALNSDADGLPPPDPAGYMSYGIGPLRPAPTEGAGWMYAAGELGMTASDLAKWDIAMMDARLLSRASWRTLETEVLLKNGVGTGYGLGVSVGMDGARRLISHTGEVSGFTATNRVYPDDRAAIVVLTNQDAATAHGAIAAAIGRLLFASQDANTAARTAQARQIFEGLQRGTIDRTQLTDNASAYFDETALKDFGASLGPLGPPQTFVQVAQTPRGGMLERVFRATFPGRTLRVWTYEMPDGKLEQYQVAAQN